jgi:UDP-N-acetyl-2-amino-2-deoxyglucuronate dehydrogenase
VLNPYSISSLEELQVETGKNIYPILQLRLHPSIVKLKENYWSDKGGNEVELKYVTPRGKWYHYSWKGDEIKSGGIATNIGIHFFDMLLWIFGDVKNNYVSHHTKNSSQGYLELEKANVDWSLSVDERDLPHEDWKAFRSIKVNGEEIDFSDGFTYLHTQSYQEILNGNGFRLEDSKPALDLVHKIRNYKT